MKYRGILIKNGINKNRLILVHALIHFCADYHSGQWSRGYRLLCRSFDWLKSQGIDRPLDIPLRPKGQEIYKRLKAKYISMI